jgi:HEAT repeat protein
LGRITYEPSVDALISMIEKNNDEDVYIRHAGVLALSRIGAEEKMAGLVNSSSRSLRIAAVLVLRRLHSEKVALFLKDADEYIVTEAARAINDDLSITGALPALAETLNEKRFINEPLIRRAISACLRVGGDKELGILLDYATREDASAALRAEALATIGSWPSPSTLDRVDGRARGKVERDPAPVVAKVQPHVIAFLKNSNPDVLVATAQMIGKLGIKDYNANLETLMKQSKSAEVRTAMLIALNDLKSDHMESIIKTGMADKDEEVRTAAVGLLNELNITKESLPGIV